MPDGRYVSSQGHVLVIRVPVPGQSASQGQAPPVQIEPGPAQTTATAWIAAVVYEPYRGHEEG